MPQRGDPGAEVLRLALHAAPSGIMVVDEQGSILFANQTLAEMFGYQLADMLGQPVEMLLPEPHVQTHRDHLAAYLRDPRPRPMGAGRDLVGVARGGRQFPVEIGLQPATGPSGPMVVATVVDITARKAIEERLRRHEEQLEDLVAERTRELREAQREKERIVEQLIQSEKMATIGTLVSGIGHEINNPLYVATATAEALTMESDHQRCRDYGRQMLRQLRNIGDTVSNLSRYAQPAARRDLQAVDLYAALQGAIRLAQRTASTERVEIRAPREAVPEIWAKPDEVQQVLFNIIRNAAQAMGERGLIEIGTLHDGEQVAIRIRDSGPGIPAQHLNQVFDPFFTTKGPDQGEGLGLFIVRQIVHQCGGRIEVENAAEGGAVFTVWFAAADPEQARGGVNEAPHPGSRRRG